MVPPVTWIDDIALFVQDPCPDRLAAKVSRAFSAVRHRSHAAGFELNVKPGKSEALVRLQCRGCQATHGRLAQEHSEGLRCQGPLGTIVLFLTSAYTHLGQCQTASMSVAAEADFRTARAQDALQHARFLCANQHIPVATKMVLTQSLVFSRLLFSSETWHEMPETVLARLDAFVLRVFRKVLRLSNYANAECTTNQCLPRIPSLLPVV